MIDSIHDCLFVSTIETDFFLNSFLVTHFLFRLGNCVNSLSSIRFIWWDLCKGIIGFSYFSFHRYSNNSVCHNRFCDPFIFTNETSFSKSGRKCGSGLCQESQSTQRILEYFRFKKLEWYQKNPNCLCPTSKIQIHWCIPFQLNPTDERMVE